MSFKLSLLNFHASAFRHGDTTNNPFFISFHFHVPSRFIYSALYASPFFILTLFFNMASSYPGMPQCESADWTRSLSQSDMEDSQRVYSSSSSNSVRVVKSPQQVADELSQNIKFVHLDCQKSLGKYSTLILNLNFIGSLAQCQ